MHHLCSHTLSLSLYIYTVPTLFVRHNRLLITSTFHPFLPHHAPSLHTQSRRSLVYVVNSVYVYLLKSVHIQSDPLQLCFPIDI